ncbi:MAG: tyrosine-type recombinase/integrase [Atopobium sp.]|nr:tyrosine-type recombinase/integrase [Atopobium sp.]
MNNTITADSIRQYSEYMSERERSGATIQKYVHELELLKEYLCGRAVTKNELIDYRIHASAVYKAETVNGKINAINSFLKFNGMNDCVLRLLRIQKKPFLDEDRELTETEYKRLLKAARAHDNRRLYYLMMTLSGTGIRISELKYITVEAVKAGQAEVSMKGKERVILIPAELRKRLSSYMKEEEITSGYVFCTRSGKPLNRSNICHDMKKLCSDAEVNPRKVFPHNFRHLFARQFYAIEKNLAHLADILGHSSVETTRIYLKSSAREYDRTLSRMKLII